MLFISGVAVMVAACWPLVIDSRIKAKYDLPLLRMFRAIPSTWTPRTQIGMSGTAEARGIADFAD